MAISVSNDMKFLVLNLALWTDTRCNSNKAKGMHDRQHNGSCHSNALVIVTRLLGTFVLLGPCIDIAVPSFFDTLIGQLCV